MGKIISTLYPIPLSELTQQMRIGEHFFPIDNLCEKSKPVLCEEQENIFQMASAENFT